MMQCVGMNLQKKRRPDTDPWSCRAKRVCLGAELQESECPMETSLTFSASNQQPEQQVCVVQSRSALCCPRCLAGEPVFVVHLHCC
ncbi:uncharacterized protein si:ch211-221j21.3 isoform X2 [Eleginops maclovinus]|uniref:uncharacterized protein si:ch211-221j21.3 isoform X2 n=1 Tax=Eleginops maclovinus TaxID=56733 RepID=UPI0030806251